MAQQEGIVDTAIGQLDAAKPRDDLEEFLWRNEQILTRENRQKTTTEFYNKLNGELELDDLLLNVK